MGVAVGTGDAVGATVGGLVITGAAVGGEVGAPVGAVVSAAVGADVVRMVGVDVRGSGVLPGWSDSPGTDDAVAPAAPDAGALVGDALAPPGAIALALSCVRPKPASATPTAREGPRRTYKVKEARPRWPGARSIDFPSSAPTLW
jgi:hypothetical protein